MGSRHWTAALLGACVMAGMSWAQEPVQPKPEQRQSEGPLQEAPLFERHDANGDGVLTRDEVPARGQFWFDRLGKDRITREEVEQVRARMREQGRAGQGRGAGRQQVRQRGAQQPGQGQQLRQGQQARQGQQQRLQQGQRPGQQQQARQGRQAGQGQQLKQGQQLGRGQRPGGQGRRAAPQQGRRTGPRTGAQAPRRQVNRGRGVQPGQGRGAAVRRQASRSRLDEMRREHPLLFRELARMRRQEPERFEALRRRVEQRRRAAQQAPTRRPASRPI